jgi:hypothetical protein
MKPIRLCLFAASLAATSTVLAQTQAPERTQIGSFNDWSAWSYTGGLVAPDAGGTVCYIYSEPKELLPPKLDHGKVSFAVSKSPAEGIQAEANFVAGYTLKESSAVTVDIDGRKFTMFTKGDSAWLVNPGEEADLLAAMKAGRKMTVTAVSGKNNDTVYNYSLSGVTAATNKMQEVCK